MLLSSGRRGVWWILLNSFGGVACNIIHVSLDFWKTNTFVRLLVNVFLMWQLLRCVQAASLCTAEIDVSPHFLLRFKVWNSWVISENSLWHHSSFERWGIVRSRFHFTLVLFQSVRLLQTFVVFEVLGYLTANTHEFCLVWSYCILVLIVEVPVEMRFWRNQVLIKPFVIIFFWNNVWQVVIIIVWGCYKSLFTFDLESRLRLFTIPVQGVFEKLIRRLALIWVATA